MRRGGEPSAVPMSRDVREKGWAPARYWVVWWTLLLLAVPLFYVVMAPIWIGIRLAAWAAELRARARTA